MVHVNNNSLANKKPSYITACRNLPGKCENKYLLLFEYKSTIWYKYMTNVFYQGKYEWAGNPDVGDCSLRVMNAALEYDGKHK